MKTPFKTILYLTLATAALLGVIILALTTKKRKTYIYQPKSRMPQPLTAKI